MQEFLVLGPAPRLTGLTASLLSAHCANLRWAGELRNWGLSDQERREMADSEGWELAKREPLRPANSDAWSLDDNMVNRMITW